MSDPYTVGGPTDLPNDAPARLPARVWIVWLAVIGAIILLMVVKYRMNSRVEMLSQHRFEELVDLGRIVRGIVYYDARSSLTEVSGTYTKLQDSGSVQVVPFKASVRLTESLERKLFNLPQFEAHEASGFWPSLVYSIVPFVIIAVVIWFFFIRRIKLTATNAPVDSQPLTLEQQKRFDRILSKWEEQARRMDGVLDRMERDRGE